jgi:2-polyprenyl-3-methyl-5-hydroxy-6-metoxy-1,4-benzoquinol methylase
VTLHSQLKQSEWHQQWVLFADNERFLFDEWIAPRTMHDFAGKDVLECGCGGGQHTAFVAAVAKSITAVDLNTTDLARARMADISNVRFVEADIAALDLGERFDVVFCIGVIHHTDDPDRTFEAIYRHCKPGGLVVVWTYSAEGNEVVRFVVEPLRAMFLRWMPRSLLVWLSEIITLLLYPVVFTVYVPKATSFLPYHEYFRNFRRLGFRRNVLNVFDKLNAPQTRFTTMATCLRWFDAERFEPASICIRKYAGVSYSLSGTKRQPPTRNS